MFLCRACFLLVLQLCQCTADAEARVAGFDDVVNVSLCSSLIGVCEKFVVFAFFLGEKSFGVSLCLCLFCTENGDGTAGTHHGDFSRRPSIVQVGLELLAAHHDVTATIALTECHRYLRHCSLTIGKEQLGSMINDGIVLLACSRQEARHVNQRNDRDVE